MSKVHELRKKALEAVRDRDWTKAIQLYERICAADSGNGGPRNELGDIFLKNGDVESAIGQFQEAARLYLEFGLTNNAVAVHKKILRHDPNHLHSLWVLGEIRLDQGLEAEASTAFLDFLSRAENLSESERDAFVSRGLQLVEKMGDDPEILSRLDAIFAGWDRGQERAQVLVAKARLAHEEGEFEVRDKYVEHARAAFEHLDALPDYVSFRRSFEGGDADDVESDDGGVSVSAMGDENASSDGDDDFAGPEIELDENESFDPSMEIELDLDTADLDAEPATNELDLGFDFDEDALSGAVERVSGSAPRFDAPADVDAVPVAATIDDPSAQVAAEVADATVDATEEEETVDLLAEILSDESFDVKGAEQRQIDSIEQDVRGQIGAQVADDDHAGQYELGLVYMDMGLFEQATEAFGRAAEGEQEALRALEMHGTCLCRLGRDDEAMQVFQRGLEVPGFPERAYLGLHYGVGVCHENAGRHAEALEHLERVAAVDAEFLDVAERVHRLRTAGQV